MFSKIPGITRASAADRLTLWSRCGVLGLGSFLLVLLIVARWLTPSLQGFGTHQGLGLPRCTVVELFGVRCPTCGMTTSWAQLMRGNLWKSFQANSGGTFLGLLALAATPWLFVSAWQGRWWMVRPNEWTVLITLMVVLVITLFDWSFRLNGW